MTRPYRPTRAEQETVIRWDREEQVVHIWSADPVTWRKLARLGIPPTKETRYRDGGEVSGRFYRLPLARFSWGLRKKSGGTGRPFGRSEPAHQASLTASGVKAAPIPHALASQSGNPAILRQVATK